MSLGTPSVSPIAVGQPIFVGMSITNTSAAPIGPFTYTFQGSANTNLSPNFADPHTCTRAGGNSISCIYMGALQPGMMDNSMSVTATPLSAGAYDVMASVGPALGSSVTANSVDLPLTAIVGTADLQVSQRVSNTQPAAGAPLTYTIDIKNAGPNTAFGAALREYVGVDGTPLGATATDGAPCTIAGRQQSSVHCPPGAPTHMPTVAEPPLPRSPARWFCVSVFASSTTPIVVPSGSPFATDL